MTTPTPQFTDAAALEALSEVARGAPRLRRNANFHLSESEPANRLLNAIEPGSYIRPHRHLDPNKDETMVVVRGSLGMLWFRDDGVVAGQALLSPGGNCVVNIPHGCWHTLVALESGTVFFEDGVWGKVKAGMPAFFEQMLQRNPTGRMATPEEVAAATVFLASPRSAFTTGVNLVVDGAFGANPHCYGSPYRCAGCAAQPLA